MSSTKSLSPVIGSIVHCPSFFNDMITHCLCMKRPVYIRLQSYAYYIYIYAVSLVTVKVILTTTGFVKWCIEGNYIFKWIHHATLFPSSASAGRCQLLDKQVPRHRVLFDDFPKSTFFTPISSRVCYLHQIETIIVNINNL